MGNSNSRKRAGGNEKTEIKDVIIRKANTLGTENISCIGKEDSLLMGDITKETNCVSLLYYESNFTPCYLQSSLIAYFDTIDKFNNDYPDNNKEYDDPLTRLKIPPHLVYKIRNTKNYIEPLLNREELLRRQNQLLAEYNEWEKELKEQTQERILVDIEKINLEHDRLIAERKERQRKDDELFQERMRILQERK
jgi:hypothetical protein